MRDEGRDNFYMLGWLDQYMIGHKGFIAGGCFKNIFNKEKVKDLDIFFESENDWQDAVDYFDTMCPGYNGDDKRDEDYTFYYENSKVKAYKNVKSGIVVELCRSIFGTAEQVITQFDFTITKFAYYKKRTMEPEMDGLELTGKAVETIEYRVLYVDDYFEHLLTGRLVVDDKIPFPMSTFERMIRYIGYGYKPCRETKMKIVNSLRDLNDDQVEANGSLYAGMD